MKALTAATKRHLEPLRLGENDRLFLSVDEDATHFVAKIRSVSHITGQVTACFNYQARTVFPARVAERKQDHSTHDCWRFAATDFTVYAISQSWPAEKLVFETVEAKTVYDYLLTTNVANFRNAEVIAAFRATKEVPERAQKLGKWDDPDLCLAPYQKIGAHCCLVSEGFALFMKQGTGKTPTAIAAIDENSKKVVGRLHRTLVIAPKNVRLNWQREVEKFTTVRTKATVLRGGMMKRVKQMIEALSASPDHDSTVVIVGYETMVRMIEQLKCVEWDLIIADEGHAIKWPTTLRSKTSHALRDHGAKRILMTGTPIANSPLDLYSQLEFLRKGCSGFNSWKNFRTFYGVFEEAQHGDKLVAVQNMPFLKERLAQVSFIVSKEEALPDLPKKTQDIIEVVMTPQQREAYDQVKKALIFKMEDQLDRAKNKALVVTNILTQMLRLAQITSGFIAWDAVYGDDGSVLSPKSYEEFTPNVKIDAIVEELKSKTPDQKTIIWSCWVQNIKAVKERLDMEGIKAVTFYGQNTDKEREEAERLFNFDPECKVCVANPGCGGAGLNLLGYPPGAPDGYTTNCDHSIYMSQDWSAIKRQQSGDRNHRRGTRVPVRETDLCVAGTIDEEIRVRVMKKGEMAFTVSDVRDILKAVLGGVVDDE